MCTKFKNRNWANNGQTLPNDDQTPRVADNKGIEGFNLLITHSLPGLRAHCDTTPTMNENNSQWAQIWFTFQWQKHPIRLNTSETLWHLHFIPPPLVHKNNVAFTEHQDRDRNSRFFYESTVGLLQPSATYVKLLNETKLIWLVKISTNVWVINTSKWTALRNLHRNIFNFKI